MTDDRNTLLGVAHAERMRLGRTIQYTDPAVWDKPSACEGWWNSYIIAHLAAADTAAAQLMAGEAATELDEYRETLGDQPFTVDGFNDVTVSRRAETSVRELLKTWGTAAESFLAHAALLSDHDWQTKTFGWYAGQIAPRFLIQSRLVEWWIHGEDIRASAGLGPQWQQTPVNMTIDLALRLLPWTLSKAGIDLGGATLGVTVEGPGYGQWQRGLGSANVPPKTKPAATLEGRAPQLALVAAGRLTPEEVLDAGTILIDGDRAIGETALRHLTAYL